MADESNKYIERPLSVDYVQGILVKLADTLDKYAPLIPDIEKMREEILALKPKDQFDAVMICLETLSKYKSTSPLMTELFENVRQDFWHGSYENYPPYTGEFYIGSAAD